MIEENDIEIEEEADGWTDKQIFICIVIFLLMSPFIVVVLDFIIQLFVYRIDPLIHHFITEELRL